MYAEAKAAHGGLKPAARALGIPETTFRRRLEKELDQPAYTAPALEDPQEPIEALLARAQSLYDHKARAEDAAEWCSVQVHDKKPIGVLWFGDPHLGDNGCDIGLLRRHIQLCNETSGLYGANIGDTTNNWVTGGKLAKLWAEQDASISTERRLAKWFLRESGVNWIVWLIGNHDAWNSGEALLREMNTTGVFMQNWEAKFRFVFPTGEEIKVHAAHNFKGFSDWNPMHGPLKASIKSSNADLYVAGHIHTPGSMQIDLPGSDRFPLLLRVSSYKRYDLHAKLHGFPDHKRGSAVLTIFNPDATDHSGKITHFFDVELGARVLTMLRGHAPSRRISEKPAQKTRKSTHERGPEGRQRKGSGRSAPARCGVGSGRGSDARGSKVRTSKLGKGNGVESRGRGSAKAPKRVRGRRGAR
jgi:hypothetical protein